MRYRKKPIIIEAFQMTRERRQDNSDWPEWLNIAWNMPDGPGQVFPSNFPKSDGKDKIAIRTLEGVMTVDWNDFIIKGIHGELYPCKPDVFKKTYEKVEDNE